MSLPRRKTPDWRPSRSEAVEARPDTEAAESGADHGLATRAAWLHFAGGLTQAEVADRLGMTRLKAHRLIARATREGLVRVFIDGSIGECVALEQRLCDCHRLAFCQVAPALDSAASSTDDALPLKSLGLLGAQYLRLVLDGGEAKLIGVGHGRTLAACVDHLPRTQAGHTRFVSLLGGLTRKLAANPYEVIHRLAERTGAEAYVMPLPLIANTVEDRAVLLAQRGVAEVLALAQRADLLLAGIGAVDQHASLSTTGMILPAEVAEVRKAGARGEILGHFIDAAGRVLDTSVSRRTLSLPVESLRNRRIIAIAGGKAKIDAIAAVLASGLVHGLITDERTATALTAAAIPNGTPAATRRRSRP